MAYRQAQTFYIDKETVNNADTVLLTSVEIYFKRRPQSVNAAGVDVVILETGFENEPLADKNIPNTSVHVTRADVVATSDASVSTKFPFKTPVALKTNTFYAIALNCSSEYVVWTDRRRGRNVGLATTTVVSGKFDGKYYEMASGTLRPLNDTDMKFTVNVAKFLANTATVELVPRALEFVAYDYASGSIGGGEYVFVDAGGAANGALSSNITFYATGSANIVSTSTSVKGQGSTDFNAAGFRKGGFIVLTDGTSSNTCVRKIERFVSNSHIVVNQPPTFTSAAAKFKLTSVARVFENRPYAKTLIGYDSTANSTLSFSTDSVKTLKLAYGGRGYSNSAHLVIYGANNTANATANVVTNANGTITSINITSTGRGFRDGPLQYSFVQPTGPDPDAADTNIVELTVTGIESSNSAVWDNRMLSLQDRTLDYMSSLTPFTVGEMVYIGDPDTVNDDNIRTTTLPVELPVAAGVVIARSVVGTNGTITVRTSPAKAASLAAANTVFTLDVNTRNFERGWYTDRQNVWLDTPMTSSDDAESWLVWAAKATVDSTNQPASSNTEEAAILDTVSIGAWLRGEDSGTVVDARKINNIAFRTLHPTIDWYTLPASATANTTANFSDATYTVNGAYEKDVRNDRLSSFGFGPVLASRSNEAANANNLFNAGSNTVSSGVVKVNMGVSQSNASLFQSPSISTARSDLMLFKPLINDAASNEYGRYGSAVSKHISKKVTFAEGRAAEDIRVYINAFAPQNTAIKVYAKVHNAADPEPFDDKSWTELVPDSTAISDSNDLNDLVEIGYSFPSQPPSSLTLDGTVVIANTTITGSNTLFESALVVGDLIKLYDPLFPEDYHIGVVGNIASNTSLTLSTTLEADQSGYKVDLLDSTAKHSVYNNFENFYQSRYFNNAMVPFDTYNSYAIKIVLLSLDGISVPEVDDVRAIGVSA